MQSGKGVIQKVVIAVAIIVFIIFGFMVFVYKNNDRIMSQNTEYIGDATKQKSQILYHILNGAQENLNIRSSMYGQNLTEETLDYEYFMKISQDTLFDHVEFIDKNGTLFMGTYHPAAILRNPNNKEAAFGDWLKVRDKIEELGIEI